ncbi:META domain-containing protein [Deinococcus koreensis]|uniref:DUF306 domain-containing protein n=1 Tax=Deinococcus koreensis TaxID=2054903 RepID=A0A2K3UVS0_9DEIO|nr:META domain-containing protein [Deinococcus koreensis]PNY80639.1 hypothetical protein CVO96_04025 [Deinococcus koreensis]
MLPLLALLALTFGGGPGAAGPGGAAMTPPALALGDTIWTLTSLSLGGVSIAPGRRLTRPSLRLSGPSLTGPSLTGTTGCSPLKASVRVRGQSIVIRGIDAGSSDRCPDHALSLREDFTFLLGSATRYELQGETLTISGPAGFLKFIRGAGDPPARPER